MNVDIDPILAKIGEDFGESIDEVVALYHQSYDVLKTANEELRIKQSLRRVKVYYTRKHGGSKKGKLVEIEGVIGGLSKLRDINDYKRKEAEKKWQESPNEAMASGLVNLNGEPVDARGNPLVENYTRSLIIIGRELGTTAWKEYVLELWGNTAREIAFRFWTPFKMSANTKGPIGLGEKLSRSTYTQLERLKGIDWDLEAMVSQAIKTRKLVELEDWIARKKEHKGAICWVEGIISKVNPNPSQKTGKRSVTIMDEEGIVGEVLVTFEVEIELGDAKQCDRVIIGGEPYLSKSKDTEGKVFMNGYFFFVVPSERIEADVDVTPEDSNKGVLEWLE